MKPPPDRKTIVKELEERLKKKWASESQNPQGKEEGTKLTTPSTTRTKNPLLKRL